MSPQARRSRGYRPDDVEHASSTGHRGFYGPCLDRGVRRRADPLRESGVDVLVATSPGSGVDRIRERFGVDVVTIPMNREITPRVDLSGLREWWRLLARERPGLVVSVTPKASLLAMVATRVTRVPGRLYFLAALRLEGERGARRHVLVWCERLTAVCASDVVVNSRSLQDAALKHR